jgi:uncharacterized protein (DUF2164 family)|tara:strand:- start:404 stop:664 length:261 start_codon:yes stop_codon:yes gene_type:complete
MAITSPQKFTEEELKKIQDLQLKMGNITSKLGSLYYNKIKLEEQEKTIKEELSSIENEELKLANELTSKYGKGSLDIESGEFTPAK